MLHCTTILHPTDFSGPARCAFEVARDLAHGPGREVLVVHVAPTRHFRDRSRRRELEDALHQLTVSDPEVRIRGLLLAGDPADQIVSTATQVGCGLIVMGTTGRTGLSWLLHGSVARAVQASARCPVLTIHLPPGDGRYAVGAAADDRVPQRGREPHVPAG